MRTRMYGGVRGRKTKVGGKPTFVFLLLDSFSCCSRPAYCLTDGEQNLVAILDESQPKKRPPMIPTIVPTITSPR